MSQTDWKPAPTTPCPTCGGLVEYCVWESSDGAFMDTHYRCINPDCGDRWWVDGPDA